MMTDGRILFGTIYRSAHISEKGAKHLMQQVTSGPLQMKMNIPTQSRWEYKYQFTFHVYLKILHAGRL